MFGMPPDLLGTRSCRHPTRALRQGKDHSPLARSKRSGNRPRHRTADSAEPDRELEMPMSRRQPSGLECNRPSTHQLIPPPDGVAGGRDLPARGRPRGSASRQGGSEALPKNRNLRPYGPSSMRPTGLRDPTAFVDPRTGLPPGQGRAATVGYALCCLPIPTRRRPSSGHAATRACAPPRPLFPPPPGNRYDGGRGYGV